MKKRVADIVWETVLERGIDQCFAVVGGGAMHLDNALGLNPNIHKVFNHHEQACSMAAEAYARISGKLASVCVTSGPGGTNAITGVMGAWQDSLPMLVLSGQVRYAISVPASGLLLRTRGIQEFDILGSVGNMTKYAKMVIDPLSIRMEVNKAIDIALSGRRGPVWLDIPMDVQSAIVEEEDLYANEPQPTALQASTAEVRAVLESLRGAKRPVLLCGNGIANSNTLSEFRHFAEQLRIPVIGACIAADAMYADYDRYYGMSGSIGPRPGNFIVQNADVILSLGCSLGYKMTGFAQEAFAPHAEIISVDIDANELKKPGVRIDRLVHCDLASFFDTAKPLLEKMPTDPSWIAYCDKLKARFSPFEPGEGMPAQERVCMYTFWKAFMQHEPDDSICVLGNNTLNSAKLQIGIQKPAQRIVANNNCGSMGADLPEAIGAAVATGKTIYCITGDGSIMMNLQELQTMKHYDLPVKIVVCENNGYNAICQTSKNFFQGYNVGCTPETGVSFPPFSKVADAFGFEHRYCRNNAELDEALEWFFAAKGRVMLELWQRLDDPINPKVMSRMLPDGSFATPALQDMAPFLERDEYDSLMLWNR